MDVHAEGSKAAAARSSAVDEKVNNERAGLLDMKGKHREQSKGEVTGQNTNHEDLNEDAESVYDSDDDESLHCAICLSVIDDRTVIQPCCHDAYCFACILAWSEQSRRCPLCMANVELLIHNIRSERDFTKYHLPLLLKSDSPPPQRSFRELQDGARRQLFNRPTHPRFKYADWRARNKPVVMPEVDAEDLALEKRKYIYKHGLYVKHVASNRYTRFRDHTVQQISTSPELKQRMTKWLRRELRVFDGVDLEFLVGYSLNIASQLELRSDSATRLLAEFLGEDQAEHFWHETCSFLRSPFKDIRQYDKAVQYDRPPCKLEDNASLGPRSPQGVKRSRGRRSPSVAPNTLDRQTHTGRDERSDSNAYRKRSASPPKRKTIDEPERLRRGDSYIPSYSRLSRTKPRARSRSLGDPAEKSRGRRESRPTPIPNAFVAESHLTEGDSAPVLHDFDMEDAISLGESDLDTAPLVTPQDSQIIPQAIPVGQSHVKSALNIRGLAASRPTAAQSSIDVIKELGPDLLSRLSSSQQSRRDGNQEGDAEFVNGHGNPAILRKGRGFRRGQITEAMQADLMAKVDIEGRESNGNSGLTANKGSAASEDTEASLREHVLAVLRQRRLEKMRREVDAADQDAQVQPEVNGSLPPSLPAKVADPSDPSGARDTRAKLRDRLAQGRAALSPTIESSQSPRTNTGSPTLGEASPTITGTTSKEMELKQRLAARRLSMKM